MSAKCPYYHGSITRIQAEEKVRAAKADGSFLVRDGSSVANSYSLCLLWNGVVYQYRILTSKDGRLYLESKSPESAKTYSDLASLVEGMVNKGDKNGMQCALMHGLPCAHGEDEAADSSDDSDYKDDSDFIRSCQRDSAAATAQPAGAGGGGGAGVDDAHLPDKAAAWVLRNEATYENERTLDLPIVKQLRRKLAQLDSVAGSSWDADEYGGFLDTVNGYLDHGFVEDLKAMQADSSRSGTVPVHHFRKLIGEEGKDLAECVSAFCRKLEALRLIFGGDPSTEEMHPIPETGSTYASLLATVCTLKQLLVSTHVQAIKLMETATIQQCIIAASVERPVSIQDVSFDVRLRSGLVGFVPHIVRVEVQAGKIGIVKCSATSFDEMYYIPVQNVLQVIKEADNSSRLTLIVSDKKKELYCFSDVRAREHFCQLVQQMKRIHTPTSDIEEISIFIGTWNVGYADPFSAGGGISTWLRSTGSGKTRASALSTVPHDLYVVGIQESGLGEKDWLQRLKKTLHVMFNVEFHTVAVCALWAIKLVVLVKPEHKNRISRVKQDTVKTGLANALGNKGAAAVSFCFEGTSFCFVNAHLTANTEKCERRNQNFRDILHGLSSSQGNRVLSDFDLTHLFHHVFWFGDLNYRVEDDVNVVVERAKKEEYQAMLLHDQLARVKDGNKAFYSFVEDPITFPPTYRYKKGSINEFHYRKEKKTGVKLNTPSWCDRVLWKSYPNLHIQNTSYGIVRDAVASDHKPLFSSFGVAIAATGSARSQNDTIAAMSIFMQNVEAKIQTSQKDHDFQLVICSTCLEAPIHCNASKNEGPADHGSSCTVHFDNIDELRPVINDPTYIQEQHLLVAVKSTGDGYGPAELYGACVVPLSDVFENYMAFFKYDLMHMGEKSGSLSGALKGKVSGVTRGQSFRKCRKSIVVFNENEVPPVKWEEPIAEEPQQPAAAPHAGGPMAGRPMPPLPTSEQPNSSGGGRMPHARSVPDLLERPKHRSAAPVPSAALATAAAGGSAPPPQLQLLLPPQQHGAWRSVTSVEEPQSHTGSGSPRSSPLTSAAAAAAHTDASAAAVSAASAHASSSSSPGIKPHSRPVPVPAAASSRAAGPQGDAVPANSATKTPTPFTPAAAPRPAAALPVTAPREAAATAIGVSLTNAVAAWLGGIGLRQYTQLFCDNGWKDVRSLSQLTESALLDAGIDRRHVAAILDYAALLK